MRCAGPVATYRPFGARVAAITAGSCLVAVVLVAALTLDDRVRASFTPVQVGTLLGFLAAVLLILHGIARTLVRTDAAGITVRNGFRSHRLGWAEAVNITLPRGAPWAVLDTADGSVVAVMAVQQADGDRARAAVRNLRAGLAQHTPAEPDR